MKKLIVMLLLIAVCFSFVPHAFAEYNPTVLTQTETEVQSREGESTLGYVPVPFGDQYGATNWKSLSQAMAHYGYDFTYYCCGGAGTLYNYYYCFSDGSRMYFGVH